MQQHLSFDIPMVWSRVREVRQRVAESLASFPQELRDATLMTASELLENAIKYGESVPGAPAAIFDLRVGDGTVQFEVRNGTTSLEAVARVKRRVEELQNAENHETLYMRHLATLLADPTRAGELGLYRIGFEGKFELGCSYEGQILTVTATRKYAK